MNMGLDEAGRHQPATEIDGFAVGCKAGFDGGDPSVGDADIGQLMLGANARAFLRMSIHGPSRYELTLAITPRCRDCPNGLRQRRVLGDLMRPQASFPRPFPRS